MIKRAWIALLFLSLVACSRNASENASREAPTPERVEVPGFPNAVQAGDLLFGAQPTPEALRELKDRGYRTVLSTRGEGELDWDEGQGVASLGMAFASIPMNKPVQVITDQQVEQFARLMATGQRPMVLHCSSGNRVAGLWTVWLVEYEGMDPAQALVLGTKAGMSGIRPVVEKRLGIE